MWRIDRIDGSDKGGDMFVGGLVTVFVTDMDRSVRFYAEQLGLTLLQRYENHFAMIDAGRGLTLGLHPGAAASPAANRKAGISIGLYLSGQIEDAVSTLKSRGVMFTGDTIDEGSSGRFAYFTDPDGNSLYLAEMKQKYRDASGTA
jgi:predicted enzyme related to lactoylglutathione lyase